MHHQQHRGLLGIGRQVQIQALLLVAAIGQVALDLCVRCLALGSPFLQLVAQRPGAAQWRCEQEQGAEEGA